MVFPPVGLAGVDGAGAVRAGQSTGQETPQDHARLDLSGSEGGIALVTATGGIAGGWGLCLLALGLDLRVAGSGVDQPVAVGCPVI